MRIGSMTNTFFNELRALTKLPWFDLHEERLAIDPDVGSVIDVHSHLSLSFLMPSRVDQERRTEPVQTYLPERGRAIDLEIYINKNLTPSDLWRMKVDLVLGSFLPGGPRRTHTAANLLRRMGDMRITRSVIHAIDLAYISRNSELYLEVASRHPELVPFGSVHPAEKGAAERVRRLARAGIRGLKVHPSTQTIYPNDPRMSEVYDACRACRLPVLWHCGPVGIEPRRTRRYSLVHYYEEPIAAHPEVTFFLGHSGALQVDLAIQLARRYPNVVMDLSCQGLDGTRKIFEAVDHDRISFGSDWPFYHQSLGIAKVLIASEGDRGLQRKVLHDNAERWLGLSAPVATATAATA